jgi:hypothetical protein
VTNSGGPKDSRLSDDGKWWWTGTEYIPANDVPAAPASTGEVPDARRPEAGIETPVHSTTEAANVVQHMTGTVGIEGQDVVAHLRGLSGGLFTKKEPWEKEIRIPLARAGARIAGDCLTLFRNGEAVEMLSRCQPAHQVELLATRINDVGVGAPAIVRIVAYPNANVKGHKTEIKVKTYQGGVFMHAEKNYQDDASKMARGGWLPQSQSGDRRRLTVTYLRTK